MLKKTSKVFPTERYNAKYDMNIIINIDKTYNTVQFVTCTSTIDFVIIGTTLIIFVVVTGNKKYISDIQYHIIMFL